MENQKIKSVLLYSLVSFLVISGLFACFIYVRVVNTGTFAPGVEIGGVSVQGESLEEAAEAISRNISGLLASRVTFYKDDYVYETRLGDLCLPIDAGEIVQTVWQKEKTRSWHTKILNLNGKQKVIYPVALSYDPVIKKNLIQEWNNSWGIAAQNASLDMSDGAIVSVVPGRAGTEVDAEATFSALPVEMDKAAVFRVPIIVTYKEPKITDSMLSNMVLLSTYTTQYNTAQVNRSHNISIAAATIDKKLVAPHVVFSFNDAIGDCTATKGYLEAMVIVSGKFEPGLAGGICQVSSTLYNASLLAGMDIVERHNHSLAVSYVPLGRDATVSSGICDFQFRNNTEHPIYIRTSASSGRLTMNIYGDLLDKKKIEIYNIIDQTLDFNTVTEQDPSLKPGEEKVDHNGQLGYVVRAFRSFYTGDGQIIKTELLSRDRYDPLDKLIYVGTATGPASQINTDIQPSEDNPVLDVNNPPVQWVSPNMPIDPGLIRP